MNGQIQYGALSPLTSRPTRQAVPDPTELARAIALHGLPEVEPLRRLPPGDRCHFRTPVRFGRRRADQIGHLELTAGWLRFSGATDITVAWSEVSRAEREGREIVISLRDSRRLFRFGCHTDEEAARGAGIARHLATQIAV